MPLSLQALLTFGAAWLLDFAYAYYTIATARLEAVKASLWAAGIMALGGYNIISVSSVWWMVFFSALGGGLGTFKAIRMNIKGDI